jgi:tetratricopeptide (TPR) repeat protein
MGQAPRALPKYEEALKIFEAMQSLDPSNANAARAVAIEDEKIADLLAGSGNRDRARQFYGKALAMAQKRAATDPMNAGARDDVQRVSEALARLDRR